MPRSVQDQLETLAENAAEVLPVEELRIKLERGRPLRAKLGLDPTAEHVTLGWAVVLRKLRVFQELGHTAVLIVGDFTARIGDPSLQDKTRPMLTKDEVDAYAERVLEQFWLVLDPDRTEVRRNSEWLEGLGTAGLLELATHATVAQMLQRDDFSQRYAAERPISVREFLYPLLQGYDSVAVEADVELGGTDQHFNLVLGRDVQRAFGQEPQVVLTMPLLEGTDGVQKMSQSYGNFIGLTEPPDEIFGKLMRVPDPLMVKFLRLCTDEDASEAERALQAGERPEQLKRRLAEAVVRLYHGEEAAKRARERFDRVFVAHEVPADVPERVIPDDCLADGLVHVPKLLKELGLAPSTTEARRILDQGGVRVDGERLGDEHVPPERLRGKVVRVGKRHFARIG